MKHKDLIINRLYRIDGKSGFFVGKLLDIKEIPANPVFNRRAVRRYICLNTKTNRKVTLKTAERFIKELTPIHQINS